MTLLYMSGFTNQVSALGWYVMMTLPNKKIYEEGCGYIKNDVTRSFDYQDPWGFHNMLSMIFTLVPSCLFILFWSYFIFPSCNSKEDKIYPDQSDGAINANDKQDQAIITTENGVEELDDDNVEDLYGGDNILKRRPMARHF